MEVCSCPTVSQWINASMLVFVGDLYLIERSHYQEHSSSQVGGIDTWFTTYLFKNLMCTEMQEDLSWRIAPSSSFLLVSFSASQVSSSIIEWSACISLLQLL